jgi:Membrane domain of glycerophosphoryl diester phosphodiesterase
MSAELRPSSLGEILDRTAHMYRSHFLVYFGISAVASASVLIPRLIGFLVLSHFVRSNQPRFMVYGAVINGCMSLLYLVPMALAMAATVHAVSANLLARSTTILEAYAAVWRRWYRYVLVLVASYVYAFSPLIVLLGIFVAAAAAMGRSESRRLMIGLFVLFFLAALAASVWWALRWSLAISAMVIENLKVHRSMKRSSLLTKGARGRIFVMVLLVFAVVLVISYAIQVPMMVLLVMSKGRLTLATQILSALGVFLSSSCVIPIWSIALTLFYYDQRIRKEGYDVEWLMEQAAAAAPYASGNLDASSRTPSAPPPLGIPAIQTDPPGPAL